MTALACKDMAPISEVNKYLSNPNASHEFACEQKPQEECLCFDGLKSWETAEVQFDLDGNKVVGNNQEKLVLFNASKDSKDQKEKDIQRMMASSDKGKRIIAYFRVRNEQKNLSKTQRKQLLGSPNIKSIMDALGAGSLDIAKDLIQAYAADGVLVTEADKQALLNEIDDL